MIKNDIYSSEFKQKLKLHSEARSNNKTVYIISASYKFDITLALELTNVTKKLILSKNKVKATKKVLTSMPVKVAWLEIRMKKKESSLHCSTVTFCNSVCRR